MDIGNFNGKLMDKNMFETTFTKCVQARKFCFPPSPDELFEKSTVDDPKRLKVNTTLKQTTWDPDMFWVGEQNEKE
jgi:hypothetical protein